MNRRNAIQMLCSLAILPIRAIAATEPGAAAGAREAIVPLELSDAQWRQRRAPASYQVLRHEATEPPFSSPLNGEKHKGRFHCAGCDLALFDSSAKYDSGTGWR